MVSCVEVLISMAHTNIGLGRASGANEDPIEVTVDEIFAEGELDEHGAWCVDDGCCIQVMSTGQIREAVAAGRLSPELKTWRDGHACWLPIHDQPELFESFATPPPVVVDLDAVADEQTLALSPSSEIGADVLLAGERQQAAAAVRAGVLTALALVATFGSMAWSAVAHPQQPVLRARHLELTVPSIARGPTPERPVLSWSPPFDAPMSGFRRRASR
jgi:hypothetical protein